MTELTLQEASEIVGGDGIEAFCVGFGLAVIATGGGAAANPVGGAVGIGCAGYAVYKWVSSQS